MKEYKIRVTHLSSRVDEPLLKTSFEKCGEVVGVVLKGSRALIVRIVPGQT